jgi:hypothetical protein
MPPLEVATAKVTDDADDFVPALVSVIATGQFDAVGDLLSHEPATELTGGESLGQHVRAGRRPRTARLLSAHAGKVVDLERVLAELNVAVPVAQEVTVSGITVAARVAVT